MHWFREGGRQHSRILYAFRSPGSVRVGRHPLEPDVLQAIEAEYPEITFDWTVVRDNQQLIEPAAEPRRRRPRTEEAPSAAPPEAVRAETPPQAPARPPIPARIEGATPDEQVAFLSQVYPVVRERILQRAIEPARQETLLALAERLNPLPWADADATTAGLQAAGEALERLSHVLARRRRRSRKKVRPGEGGDGEALDGEALAADAGDAGDASPGPSDV